MIGTPLEYFGKSVSGVKNFTEIAGRYTFQKKSEQYLLRYLLEKLSLSPDDDVLEIGCGAGNLLIPLSFFVHSITGIDHKKLLAQLKNRVPKDSGTMTLIPGEFLTAKMRGTFSKILIYSVIHYLRDEDEVLAFIRKAARLLRSGGTLLIGDIPNADMKARFLATKRGKSFSAEWQKKAGREHKKNPFLNQPVTTAPLVTIDDALTKKIVTMLEGPHMRARRVRQPETMSFGYTREDIIVEKE